MAAEKIYSSLLASLLPPGPAWTTEPGSNLTKLLKGLGEELERVDDQAGGLVLEANPLSMSTMLDVRYQEAGLPDLCKGKPDEDSEQQKEVVGKWSARGGQSIAYFYEVAEKYGFDIIIDEYAIFKIEHQGIETLGIDSEYAYSWSINYVDGQQIYFRAGENKADDRLEVAKGIGINCIFGKLKPAHTSIIYTAWDSAVDMLFKPLINYNFQDLEGVWPAELVFSRASKGTRVNSAGNITNINDNLARFDYDPVDLYCKGILLEDPKTNHVVYNRELTQSVWIKTNVTAVDDLPIINPAGNPMGYCRVVDTAVNAEHSIKCCDGLVINSAQTFTFSGYFRANEISAFRLSIIDSVTANYVYADFDLQALTTTGGAAGTGTYTISRIEPHNNGWYRCSVTGNAASANSGSLNGAKITMVNGGITYLGDGLSGLNCWGMQLEPGDPSSVIFTSTIAETRGSEAIVFATESLWWSINKSGTFQLTGFKRYQEISSQLVFYVDFAGGDSHAIRIHDDKIRYESYASGAYTAQLEDTIVPGQPFRAAFAFEQNNFGISVNGGTVITDTSGAIPNPSVWPGNQISAFNGHLTQFVCYSERLANEYLQEISTIG
jgi:uncharacterized protein YmfQ (DUF2313 family)